MAKTKAPPKGSSSVGELKLADEITQREIQERESRARDSAMRSASIAQANKDGERLDRVANRKKSPTGELDDHGQPLFRKKTKPIRIKGG